MTIVLLLRGINVGGHRKVPMAALREALAEAGFKDPRTYLQSGNVVVEAADVEGARRGVAAVLATTFDLDDVPIVTRDAVSLAAVIADNPFPAEAVADPAKLHVVFLDAEPSGGDLDPQRSPGDRWVLAGRELYVHYAKGAGQTKLDLAYIERTLDVRGTARNWNSVVALAALAG